MTNYRVEVTDFGPIIRASVEFRPLTVFVGPSNTGKSYLAALVYAMHQWLTRLVDMGIRSDMAWLPSSDGFSTVAPVALVERLRLTLQRAPGTRAALVDEIRRCLGIDDLNALNRRSASKVGGVVRFCGPLESENQIGYEFAFKSGEIALSGPGFNLDIAPFPANLSTLRAGNTASWRDLELRYAVARAVADHLRRGAGAAGRPAHYLPADRTGVMHSRQVVVGALLQTATTAGLRPSANVPLLSGVLADFLDELIAIGGTYPLRQRPLRQRNTRTELAEPFERNLLNGSVRLQRNEANYPSFTYRPAGWEEELPLMRASSMVSELAPVVLYLRHVIDAGDVLIIEEPEAHLHPAMQTMLARELARLVRAGVRIVLTTHSEWLLEQIGNLVAVSGLPQEHRAGIAGADVALAPDEVGAWFFKPVKRPRGSVVEQLELSSETGTFQTDYDEVSLALYNEGTTIFNRRQALQERPSG